MYTKIELVWPGKTEEVYAQKHPFKVVGNVGTPSGNELILGDNRLILASLEEKVNLVYIDPPFNTNKDWKNKEGELCYSDRWGGEANFLTMIYERLKLMYDLMADDASIYVHCDYRLSGSMRVVLDDIFGKDNFLNQIIWQGNSGDTSDKNRKFIKSHDILFFYTKSKDLYSWNSVYQEYGAGGKAQYKYKDDNGIFRLDNISNPGGGGYIYDLGYGEKVPSRGYCMPIGTARKWIENGTLIVEKGKVPSRKRYINEQGVRCKDIWSDISGSFRKDYPTQKPEALLERIIKASSNPGDLVADFFCGSGTTLAVAEKLGRRWLGVDSSPIAIEVTKERLKKLGASFEILEVVV